VFCTPFFSFFIWPLYCLSYSTYGFWFPFDILWPLYCLSYSTYGFWLPLWYLVAIILSVLFDLRLLIPLWYLVAIILSVLFDLRLLITPLISCGHYTVCPIRLTASDYPFDILWPLYCLSYSTYGFWLPLWYLVVIILSVLFDLRLLITPLVSCGHYTVCPIRLTIIPLVSCGHYTVCPIRLTASDYPFGILWPLYCLSYSTYGFWLPLWYLVAIILSVLFDLRLLITPLVSCGHYIVCSIRLTLLIPLWYLVAIILSVLFDLRLLITPLVS
jgi:uncharacterized membrane protein (UPF0182 family)